MDANDSSNNTEVPSKPAHNTKNKKWTDFIKNLKAIETGDRYMIYLTGIIAVCGLFVAGITYMQMSIYIDATHIENRAYLVASCQIDPPKIGQRFHVKWEIKNVGKTPAYKVKEPLSMGFESVIRDFWIPAIDRQVPDTGTVIGSDITIQEERFTDSTLAAENMSSYQTRTDRLCLYLNIVYEDVFRVPHYTRLAAYIDPKTETTIAIRGHNDAN